MVQNRWSNEDSGYRDDPRRDDARRDMRRGGEMPRDRSERREAFRYSERDRGAPAFGADDPRGRGYGSEAYGGGSDEPFGHTDERYPPSYERASRPSGIYGPGSYGAGRGSSYSDRDAWGRGDFGLGWRGQDDDYRRHDRDRGFDRFGYGRNDERGLWDRASDEVASWFGDHDAERRREQDEFRGRGPKGYARSEDRIREDVNDRLTDDSFVDASEIEVSVSGGEVTLSGTVARREQRRRAEDCAESVSGVTYVQNNIRVRNAEPSGTSAASIGQTAFGRDASATSSEAARIDSGARLRGR